MRHTTTTLLATIAMTVALGASPASAHVGTGGAVLEAGTTSTIELTVPHGCDELATTGVEVLVPGSLSVLDAVAPDGFTARVDGDVVRFEGGSLPSPDTAVFALRVHAGDVDGRVHLRTVQECGDVELLWLDIGGDGVAEGQPAPSVLVVGGSETLVDPSVIASSAAGTAAASAPAGDTPARAGTAAAGFAFVLAGIAGAAARRRRAARG